MSRLRKGALVAAPLAAAVAVAVPTALGGQAATAVSVTAGKPSEFKFTLSERAVAKGVVTFRIANKGSLKHDFKILGKKSAMLDKGKTGTLKVTFKKAGKYAFLCTVPGHAPAGMKGVLTVK